MHTSTYEWEENKKCKNDESRKKYKNMQRHEITNNLNNMLKTRQKILDML